MNQSCVPAQCSPELAHKFVWQFRGAGLHLSYGSPGILGMLQVAPEMSLFQLDHSKAWYNIIVLLSCFYGGEKKALHTRQKAWCLLFCWYHPSDSINSGLILCCLPGKHQNQASLSM